MRILRFLTLASLLFLATGCARGVTMNPELEETYAVSVDNRLGEPMIVSFDDGDGTRLLGTVGADREERFVIAGAAGLTITLVAVNEAETRTVRRTVTLQPGGTVDVVLN